MLQNTQLLTNDTTHNAHPTTFDAKSETSTEPDENHQSHFLFTYNFPSKHSPSSKIKTSLCRNYVEKEFCPYGDKCQFAHGPEELKINMEYNKSYKTKQILKKTICIGFEVYNLNGSNTITDCIKNADIALYEAKNKDRSEFFKFSDLEDEDTIELF